MADEERRKSSADLIKEARESFAAPPNRQAEEPVRPPIVRPSDGITPSYDAQLSDSVESQPAPPVRRSEPSLTSSSSSSRESTRLPSVSHSTRTATPTAPHAPVRDTTASILAGVGWLFIVVALVLAVLLAIGAFAEPDEISDLLIGGAIVVLFPLVLGVALVAAGRRRKRVVAARAGSSPTPTPAPPAGQSTGSRSPSAGVRDGETVLASIPGVPEGATKGATIGVVVAVVIGVIIFSSITDFGGFFVVAGIIFLVSRWIRKATTAAGSLGRAFPGTARLTITDQRVLMTARSWAPNTPETHMERPTSAIAAFKVATGNKPSVRIAFDDGEQVKMSTSVANAQAAKRALEAVSA